MKLFIMLLVTLGTSISFAGKCVLSVERTACPGQEKESFKKCDGKAKCDVTLEASSDKDCAKKALKECENARLDITKSKVITASFDGKDVEAKKNFCAADRSDFNKCKK